MTFARLGSGKKHHCYCFYCEEKKSERAQVINFLLKIVRLVERLGARVA